MLNNFDIKHILIYFRHIDIMLTEEIQGIQDINAVCYIVDICWWVIYLKSQWIMNYITLTSSLGISILNTHSDSDIHH